MVSGKVPTTGCRFEPDRKAQNVANKSAGSSQFAKMSVPPSDISPHSFKQVDKNDNRVTMSQKSNSNKMQNHGPPKPHQSAVNNAKSSVNFKVLNNVNQPNYVGAGKNFSVGTNCKSFNSGQNRTYHPNLFNDANITGKMNSVPHESNSFNTKMKYPDQINKNGTSLLNSPKQSLLSTPQYYNASTSVPNRSPQSFPSQYYNPSNSVPNPVSIRMQNDLNPFLTKFVNNVAVPQSHGHEVFQQHEQRCMQNIDASIKSPESQDRNKKKFHQKHTKPNYPFTGKPRHRTRMRRKGKNLEQNKEAENALPLWSFHRAPQATVKSVKYDDSDEETNSSIADTGSNPSDSESSELSDSELSEISSEFSLTSIKAKEMASSSSSYPILKASEGFVSTFWDIENCPLPSKISAVDFVKFIRNTFYEGRTEVDFFVACDVSSVNQSILRELDEASVIVVHISSTSKNAADKKLLTFLQNFQIEHRNEKSAVVLISGDSDFASFLNDMRYKHHIFINLVCKRDSRHSLFEAAHKSVYFEDLIKKLPERKQNADVQYTVIVSNLPTNMKSKNIKSSILNKIGNKNCRINMIDKVSARIVYPSRAARDKSLPLLENFLIKDRKIEFTLSEDMDDSSVSCSKKKVHKASQNTPMETLHHNVHKNDSSCEGKAASVLVHVIENANDVKYWEKNFEKMFGMNDFQLQILGVNTLGNMMIKFKSLSKAQKARKLLMNVEKGNKNSPKFLKLIKHDADLTGSNIDTGVDVLELNRKKIEECLHFIVMKKEASLKIHEKNVINVKMGISAQILGSKETVLDKLNELNEQKITFLNFTSNLKTKVQNLNPLSETFEDSKNLILHEYLRECNCISVGLPIYAKKNLILKKIKSNQVTIIRAETGSGKSTQLCQYIWRESNLCQNGLIVCTQPRKIAAVSLAKYVSSQVGCSLGDVVGYEVGMSCKTSANTAILYTTDFSMLKRIINEGLKNIACIVIDEAHERTVYTDLLLGMIKKLLPSRRDLKVVVTSATIDISIFRNYFQLSTDAVLEVPGQTFPIEDIWLENDVHLSWDYFSKTLDVAYGMLSEDAGHILAFLTTPLETEKAAEALSNRLINEACHNNIRVYFLHGKVDVQDQQKVFENLPSGIRKVVFATNCAETSVTIAGIRYVIDCGMVKEVKYDANKNMNVMSVNFVSQSSSNQRRGRAGRTRDGKCFHLYSKANYDRMDKYSIPEILSTNLGNVLLKIMKMGVKDPLQFDFVESPPKESLNSALQQLKNLKAVNNDLSLSKVGFQMACLPLEPRLSHLILKGIEMNAGYEALILSALITVSRNIFFRNNENRNEADVKKLKFCQSESDFITYFNVYKEWVTVPKSSKNKWCVLNCINARSMRSAHDLISELTHILQKELDLKMSVKFNDEVTPDMLLELIFCSFSENLCVFSGHNKFGYKSPNLAGSLVIHPSSSLCTFGKYRPDFIIYDSILKTSETFLINISPVSEFQILKATYEGKINISLEILNRLRMKNECFSPLGEIILLRYFIGKGGEKKKTMEKKFQEIVGSNQFALDVNVARGDIKLFTNHGLNEMSQIVISTINEAKQKLLSDEKEVFVIEKCSTVSAVIGSGAQIKEVIFPDDFREVKIVLKGDISISDVIGKLQLCGDIIDCREWKNYFKITFSTVSAAKKSVVVFGNEQSFSLQSIVRNNATYHDSRYYRIFLSFVRRPCTGCAFLTLDQSSFSSHVMTLLSLSYQHLSFKVARNTGDIRITGLAPTVNKAELEKLLVSKLPSDIKIAKLVIVREKSFENTKLIEESIKQKITDAFSKYVCKDDLSIELRKASSNSVFWNATVSFKNSHEGESAARIVQKANLFCQFNPIMEASIWCRREVFSVIKDEIDEALKFYTSNSDSSKSLDIKAIPKSNSNVEIRISANNISDVVDAQKCISNFVLGDQIKCRGNSTLENLFTKFGLSRLKKLCSENSKCFIDLNSREKIVTLFGNVSACNKVMMEINNFLIQLESENLKEINLMSKGHAGILRELLKTYGFDLRKLKEHCDASNIEVNSRKYVLVVKGSPESISKCEKIVQDIKKHLPETSVLENSSEVCGICQMEVAEQRHRLEYCGHAYCKECLLHLFQNSDSFPLRCLVCESPIVLVDISWAIKEEKSLQYEIYKKSLDAFILTQTDMKYCPSPNCSMIYRATKNAENIFNCPCCGNSICTNCEALFHFGMSCSLYQGCKIDDDYSLKAWMKEDPNNRKICPSCSAPIEKNEGCNHMTCWKCKTHMCWLCLAVFPTGDEVYNHQPFCPRAKEV
ncbi:uncharacterized protein LOC129224860 [Uloborus diversus]|uniref:uncharacterized protein LOC129224860 n=1 Tax=Uloborus diversus TaxID=327109 RepID=UPI00240A8F30|nr:uncharacterized protein LOC129224860 [Uloborus diversus]